MAGIVEFNFFLESLDRWHQRAPSVALCIAQTEPDSTIATSISAAMHLVETAILM